MSEPIETPPGRRHALPLSGVRVVDLTDGVAATSTRLLADLGADVILVEPPEGVASRRAHPQHEGIGLRFLTAHANKRGITLDLETRRGRRELLALTDGADIVAESLCPGRLADLGLGQQVMRQRNHRLVVMSVSEFGQSGPYRDWRGGEAVQMAMASTLTRSGAPDREPLLPPGDFATESGSLQAAFAALLAYYRAVDTGSGDYVDCAFHDMAVQALDPGFGMAGTATMGRPLSELPPGRPDARMLYPIFACADGHVRLCMLAAKHWRGMFKWLGEPTEFADPSFEQLITRFMAWDKLKAAIAALFAGQSRDELLCRGGELGIPIASLNTPFETATSDHVAARGSFVETEVAPGLVGRIANGYLELDGNRAGFRFRAPTLGEHNDDVLHMDKVADQLPGTALAAEPTTRPLSGVRVLDLGVIVVGAESGRLLADQGAEVIKIENRAFLDGARQADGPDRVSHPFAVGNRGKLSMGLNLRSPRGAAMFLDLVAKSDVVLTNFKPGTMESLGFGFEALQAVNPGLIVVDSSALGNTGPWSKRMGYGPLVRASVGLTELWRHPDSADAFGDDMTVYPDHAAARISVAAVLAALIGRRRTGRGTQISVAQMETVFCQLATQYLRESLQPGTMVARGNVGEFDSPQGVYACAGEDAHCVVAVDGDADWLNLTEVIGRTDLASRPELRTASGRVAHRLELDRAVGEWIAPLDPRDAATRLQAAGVPAGAAEHVKGLLIDPQLAARAQFGDLPQPGYASPFYVESGPALFGDIPAPALRPAPLMAEHTRWVCAKVLGLSDIEIGELASLGALELREESNA
jgi:crotonobetainyl-CoA:carnitine CoA-transferase CaiB-like acyl-CoA transferase